MLGLLLDYWLLVLGYFVEYVCDLGVLILGVLFVMLKVCGCIIEWVCVVGDVFDFFC